MLQKSFLKVAVKSFRCNFFVVVTPSGYPLSMVSLVIPHAFGTQRNGIPPTLSLRSNLVVLR